MFSIWSSPKFCHLVKSSDRKIYRINMDAGGKKCKAWTLPCKIIIIILCIHVYTNMLNSCVQKSPAKFVFSLKRTSNEMKMLERKLIGTKFENHKHMASDSHS